MQDILFIILAAVIGAVIAYFIFRKKTAEKTDEFTGQNQWFLHG